MVNRGSFIRVVHLLSQYDPRLNGHQWQVVVTYRMGICCLIGDDPDITPSLHLVTKQREQHHAPTDHWSLVYRDWDVSVLGLTVEACTSRALPDSKSAILLPPSHKSKNMLPRTRYTSQRALFRAGSDNYVLQR